MPGSPVTIRFEDGCAPGLLQSHPGLQGDGGDSFEKKFNSMPSFGRVEGKQKKCKKRARAIVQATTNLGCKGMHE
jgi:hypothetical protein